MKRIKLTKGKFALVNDADFGWLSQHRWYAQKNHYGGFSAARGKPTILMHRAIIDTPKGMLTDHRNHDTLDNRRCNLRICTTSQNCSNQNSRKNSSSRFKGVSWKKDRNKWGSNIMKNRKSINLGQFDIETEAAKCYDKAATELFGEFARTNFF